MTARDNHQASFFSAAAALPSSRLVPPPRRARRLARALLVAFALSMLALLLAPWQQSIDGAGSVIAYAPMERQQRIDAPITGRVVRWFVVEGSTVEAGAPLVELADNDPLLLDRLSEEREIIGAQVKTYEARLASLEGQLAALIEARGTAIRSAEAKAELSAQKLASSRQKLAAAKAALDTALLNSARQALLAAKGLISQRDLELVQLTEVKARTDHDAAIADVRGAEQDLAGAQADLGKARAEADAKVESAAASRSSAAADLEGSRQKLVRAGVDIARQETRTVLAPRGGTVVRILAFQGGEQVKQGAPLATIVPDVTQRAVELWVDGNDAALISPGRHVRLQFEGWPAVQFSGWPAVAVGTFGGDVAIVDAAGSSSGDFRVVVIADETVSAWPEARFLRQGTRAKGWILLDQVSLGYEVWRRFNGFPPATDLAKVTRLEDKARSKALDSKGAEDDPEGGKK
jgi:adhesin transport system membrane fusion protein